MNKKHIFRPAVLLSVIFMFVILVSCTKKQKCEVTASRALSVQAFHAINLDSDLEVVIKRSDSTYVIMEGCASDLDGVQFNQSGQEISLKRQGKGRSKSAQLTIGTAELLKLNSGGTVNVTATGFNSNVDRSIRVSGTGTIRFVGNTLTLQAEASGTSKIEMNGTTKTIMLTLSGVTTYSGYGMPAMNCSVDVSGDSRAYVDVATRLDGKVSGTSEVHYKGGASEHVNIRDLAKVIKEQ